MSAKEGAGAPRQAQRIVKLAFHTNVLGQYAAATKSLATRLEWATVA